MEQCGSTQKPAKALCRKCIHQVICKLNVVFFLFCALCNTVFGVYVSEKKMCDDCDMAALAVYTAHCRKDIV